MCSELCVPGPIKCRVWLTAMQEVALLDVRKEISFCRKVGLPILGMVENMSGFVCPKCKVITTLIRMHVTMYHTQWNSVRLKLEVSLSLSLSLPLSLPLSHCCRKNPRSSLQPLEVEGS